MTDQLSTPTAPASSTDSTASKWLTKMAKPALKTTLKGVAKGVLKEQYNSTTEEAIDSIVERVTSKQSAAQLRKLSKAISQYQKKGEGAFLELFAGERDIPRWIYSAYYALIMTLSKSAQHREELFTKIITNCVPKTDKGKRQLQEAQAILRKECGNYDCGSATYWKVLQKMPDACFLAVAVEAKKIIEDAKLEDLKVAIEESKALPTPTPPVPPPRPSTRQLPPRRLPPQYQA